jgi:hypothetical protein
VAPIINNAMMATAISMNRAELVKAISTFPILAIGKCSMISNW